MVVKVVDIIDCMRITFLCGSLEPGRDGVGDYTRRLAGELVQEGHEVLLVSLYDYYVKEELINKQVIGEFELSFVRLSTLLPMRSRYNRAIFHINRFDPNCLSLQFVPYAFHPKGVPLLLSKFLKEVGNGRKWHIMFHELWVRGSNLKNVFYASLQKLIIKDLKRQLKPAVVHTHLPMYYSSLKRLNFDVMELPLFSNIPVQNNRKGRIDKAIFRVGLFSHVDVNDNIIRFIQDIEQVLFEKKILLELLLIGSNKKVMMFGAMLEKLLDGQAIIRYTGFLQSEEVSLIIQSCDIGLTSLPRHELGKSGSVAAFISHGVPVAAPNIDYSKKIKEPPFYSDTICSAIITDADYMAISKAKEAACTVKVEIEISDIVKKFLTDINR